MDIRRKYFSMQNDKGNPAAATNVQFQTSPDSRLGLTISFAFTSVWGLNRFELHITEVMQLNLIETVAQQIADVCLAYALVQEVHVTLHKPQAPVGVPFGDVRISITRTRQ